MEASCEQISNLQEQLSAAQEIGDKEQEIDILLSIAWCAEDSGDKSLANMHLRIAANEILHSGIHLQKLHQVLGDRALLMHRSKNYADALELYQQAEAAAAAHNGTGEIAHWKGKQGHIHRLTQKYERAKKCYESALGMFRDIGDDGSNGIADLEGNLGLIAQALDQPDETLRRYRRAAEYAEKAGNSGQLCLWSKNLGRELSRRKLYTRAWEAFHQAYEEALSYGDERDIYAVAMDWVGSYAGAHRRDQSVALLLKTVERLDTLQFKYSLLRILLIDLQYLDKRDSMKEVLAQAKDIGRAIHAPENALSGFVRYIKYNDELDARGQDPESGGPDDEETSLLEYYVVKNMAKAERAHDTECMVDVAELICDVNSGLANPTTEAWGEYVSDPLYRLHVIGDTIAALAREERPAESLAISQRFKGAGFSLTTFRALQKQKNHDPLVQAVLDTRANLARQIESLKQKRVHRPLPIIESVRAAGERHLEALAELKEHDRIMHARLGGMVQHTDIIDMLPVNDAVAVCDATVAKDETVVHVLLRVNDAVIIRSVVFSQFGWSHYWKILRKLVECRYMKVISPEQREALHYMGKELHDRLLCELAKFTYKFAVTQFCVIPDAFLQSLPLGLSRICAREMEIPGLTRGDEELFGEIYPIEYCPCLQAVVVSQHQKRPQGLEKIVLLADPVGNLPGAYYTTSEVDKKISSSLNHVVLRRDEATLDRFLGEVADADIVVMGTHGVFDMVKPEKSCIALSDRNWSLGEMVAKPPFRRSPVVVLSSCQVGAIEPGSDAATSGIPGALISAGAACVVASTWPLLDIPMGYVVERLMYYLGYPGYRPAASLFRALRDLRDWPKADVLTYCENIMDEMVADGSSESFPEPYLQVDHFYDLIDESDDLSPFASPVYWGGIALYGSGWGLPAGAYVGGIESLRGHIEIELQFPALKKLKNEGKCAKAFEKLEAMLAHAESIERARLLEFKALLVWNDGNVDNPKSAMQEALVLLKQAMHTAIAEQNDQLIRNIEATRAKINLYKEE